MSPSINYAEQVLREEAERLAKLKEEASAVASSSASEAVKNRNDEESLKSSIAKVNLKDEEDFPTLGKAKGKGGFMRDMNYLFIDFYNL